MRNYDELLQKGIVGDTHFSIGATFSEAWQRVKGVKGSFWGGFGLYFAIAIGVAIVIGIITSIVSAVLLPTEAMRHAAAQGQSLSQLPLSYILFQIGIQIVQLVMTICVYFPMLAGLMLIGLRWVNHKEVSALYVTRFFKKEYITRFFFMWLAMFLIVLIPMMLVGVIAGIVSVAQLTLPLKALLVTVCVLLVLGLIYLLVGFCFAMPLIIDRFLKGWESLNVSRIVVTHHWFRVFFLFFFAGILFMLSAIPLGIPLIWTMPWVYNVFSITYRELFGIAGQDPVSLNR